MGHVYKYRRRHNIIFKRNWHCGRNFGHVKDTISAGMRWGIENGEKKNNFQTKLLREWCDEKEHKNSISWERKDILHTHAMIACVWKRQNRSDFGYKMQSWLCNLNFDWKKFIENTNHRYKYVKLYKLLTLSQECWHHQKNHCNYSINILHEEYFLYT